MITAITNISNFIQTIINFIMSTLVSLFNLFLLIPKLLTSIIAIFGNLPVWLTSIFSLSILVSFILFVLNRK